MEAWEKGINPEGNSTNPSNWDFSNSFFAGTVVTTIGEVLSFLINWGFLQLSCKAPRDVQLVDRIPLQDSLDYCGLWFSIVLQLHLLFLCIQHTTPAKKKLSAYLVHAISFCTCTAHLEVALKHSFALTTKSETYRKLQYPLKIIFFLLNFLLVVVNAQGSIIRYGNL